MKTPYFVVVILVSTFATWTNHIDGVELYGISKPSAEVAMGFTTPGRVVAVKTLVGDAIRAGEVIAELDGRVLDARIKQVALEATSSVEVDAARAELAQREQELVKITQVHAKGAATDLERERAELEVIISRFRVAAAEEKRTMASYRLEELQAERNQLFLKSPIDGIVEKLQIEAGEAPQTMDPIVLVVDCDPLWVEVPVPLGIAAGTGVGDAVEVRFPDQTAAEGTVAVIARVADSASETVLFRVDVPNSEGRRAGERVRITLPDAGTPLETRP